MSNSDSTHNVTFTVHTDQAERAVKKLDKTFSMLFTTLGRVLERLDEIEDRISKEK